MQIVKGIESATGRQVEIGFLASGVIPEPRIGTAQYLAQCRIGAKSWSQDGVATQRWGGPALGRTQAAAIGKTTGAGPSAL